jgi:hypothetical protein
MKGMSDPVPRAILLPGPFGPGAVQPGQTPVIPNIWKAGEGPGR